MSRENVPKEIAERIFAIVEQPALLDDQLAQCSIVIGSGITHLERDEELAHCLGLRSARPRTSGGSQRRRPRTRPF
jgi:hypothetical protein